VSDRVKVLSTAAVRVTSSVFQRTQLVGDRVVNKAASTSQLRHFRTYNLLE